MQTKPKRPAPPNIKAEEADACLLKGNDLSARQNYQVRLLSQRCFEERPLILTERRRPPQDAVAEYTKAVMMRPRFPRALVERGVCFRALARREEALKDFTAAIAIDPRYQLAYRLRGELLMAMDQHEKALRDLDACITLAPEDADLFKLR